MCGTGGVCKPKGAKYVKRKIKERTCMGLGMRSRGGEGVVHLATKALGALQGPSKAEGWIKARGLSGETRWELIGIRACSQACCQPP